MLDIIAGQQSDLITIALIRRKIENMGARAQQDLLVHIGAEHNYEYRAHLRREHESYTQITTALQERVRVCLEMLESVTQIILR